VRRRTWAAAATAVLAVATVVGGGLALSGTRQQALAVQPPSAGTATVEKRTLSAMVSQPGILTYRARPDGSPYSVVNQVRGTYTRLPTAGQVIHQGRVLYRVNDRPVVLLQGSTPAYRRLSAGASGPDVAELNADLVTLGYASARQLHARSALFGPHTTRALLRLQASVGMTPTGTLALGQAVFEPAEVRVTAVAAQPGGRADPGEIVLRATSTTRQVQVALEASQQTEVAVGNKVSITLPDNRTTPGVVSSVSTVATCPSSAGAAPTGPSAATPRSVSCSGGGSGSGTPTIAVDVAFSDPGAGRTWDQAPVQVGITTASVPDALTVPVTALLARSGGGYAVELAGTVTRATRHLVPVSLGLFDDADGLVQVTGPGLAAGEKVVVPAT